jgi:hypothetical protein
LTRSFEIHLTTDSGNTLTRLLSLLLRKQFANPGAASYKGKVITTGLPASPGAAVGQIVFTAEDAEAWHAQGKSAILVFTFSFYPPFHGKWSPSFYFIFSWTCASVVLSKIFC